MTEPDLPLPGNAEPTSGAVTIIYIIYSLHGFCAVMGLLTPALIVTAFLTGWPSILALLLSYWKQGDCEGT